MASMPGELTAKKPDGLLGTLKRICHTWAEKHLGVHLAADENMDRQIECLKEKVSDFAKQVKKKDLCTKNDLWMAHTNTIRKTLECPMPATVILEDDWDAIMWDLNQTALPVCGIVGTFPHQILHGSTDFQGPGTMHPFCQQDLTHLKDHVEEIHREPPGGLACKSPRKPCAWKWATQVNSPMLTVQPWML